MTRAALGSLLPPAGRINNSQYAFVEKDGKFYFEVNPPGMPEKYQLWPLDYAFGSGKTGLSFVSLLEGRNVVEMKMSYFPHEGIWRITPGQKLDNPAAAGNLANLDQSRHCIGCHVIAMSKNAFAPRQEFFGVGCESCHGPGRAHLAAVQSGAKDLQMANLGKLSGRDLNTLCGKCHQTEKDVAASPLLAKMTFRFQPYGLMKSRCFLKGGERISCLTCHEPHEGVSKDTRAYERACLNCHSGTASPSPQAKPTLAAAGKVCPVNKSRGCIACHMPQRDVLFATNERYGLVFTEHRIAVYPEKRQAVR